jgi:hypothetical protein
VVGPEQYKAMLFPPSTLHHSLILTRYRILNNSNKMAMLQSFDPSLEHTTTEKFHLFPKLPVELRTIIWKAAADRQGMLVCGTLEPPKTSSGCSNIHNQCTDKLEVSRFALLCYFC